jgi:hypothetical protein
MKRKKKQHVKTLQVISSLMIMLAPAIVNNLACGLLWGEPKYPDFK